MIADADRTPPNQVAQSALGVLSTEARGIWAGHRANMMDEPGNAMCLDVLDRALFVVCLDDTSPETASELCSNMLCEFYVFLPDSWPRSGVPPRLELTPRPS